MGKLSEPPSAAQPDHAPGLFKGLVLITGSTLQKTWGQVHWKLFDLIQLKTMLLKRS